MKAIPKEDMLSQVANRTAQEYYEKFKRETAELDRKRREAQRQRGVEVSAEMPRQAADSDDK